MQLQDTQTQQKKIKVRKNLNWQEDQRFENRTKKKVSLWENRQTILIQKIFIRKNFVAACVFITTILAWHVHMNSFILLYN
jgi:hypothetical protein